MKLEEPLLSLIYHNIWVNEDPSPTEIERGVRGFRNRVLGFRAEVEFSRKVRKTTSFKLYKGAYLLPSKKKAHPHQNPVVFTITHESPRDYIDVYNSYLKLSNNLYFIRFESDDNPDTWATRDFFNCIQLPIPHFRCYKYDKIKGFQEITSDNGFGLSNFLKNYTYRKRHIPKFPVDERTRNFLYGILNSFKQCELKEIYLERIIFDGLLGFKAVRGTPADLDSILQTPSGYFIVEVKEKDPSKGKIPGFGMDTNRAYDLYNLQEKLGMKAIYIIKQVDNQRERNHVGWKQIFINTFLNSATNSKVSGGEGMLTLQNSFVKTLITPVTSFTDF